MPFKEKQKQKILFLLRLFTEETDGTHRLTVKDILQKLAAANIPAERKGIYTDIDELRDFGLDIVCSAGQRNEYYLASRPFEPAEVRFLAEEVRGSRFITAAKSARLIDKLKSLAGPEEASELQSYIDAGRKSANETIYRSMDAITDAIGAGRKIAFRYFVYDFAKKPVYRNGGAKYVVSPYDVAADGGNSYLICHYPKYGTSSFRIDRMEDVEVLSEKTEADRRAFDTERYLSAVFGMYAGEEAVVELVAHNSLLTVMLDRFGRDVGIRRVDGERFAISVRVAVSPMFFGWCCNFGDKLKIVSPTEVAQAFRDTVATILKNY